MKLTERERDFIEPLRVARVATVDADGVAHNVPICPLLDGENVYFGTGADSRKVRNIRANSSATITFDEYSDAWSRLSGIMLQGKARIVNRQQFRRLRKKLYAKYLQYETDSPLEEETAVIVEIVPSRKFSWGL